MLKNLLTLIVLCLAVSTGSAELWAQSPETTGDDDGSSQQTEEQDDDFRRSRELEDARSRDQTYVDNTQAPDREQEKIDKLPEESRDNIRDQLVDVIVENGEWEPSDALEEYPYEPTEAARADPELARQEQEAWEEQVAKYHEREANAWGSHRGPVPGPGNPGGQEGGQAGEAGQQGAQQGSGQGSGSGDGAGGGSGAAGTYQPYSSGSSGGEDGQSTDGVSESALDFLLGRRGQGGGAGGNGDRANPPQGSPSQGNPGGSTQPAGQQAPDAGQQASAQQAAQQAADQAAQQADQSADQNADQSSDQNAPDPAETGEPSEPSEPPQEAQESEPEIDLSTPGIIAIEDLDKLEGADEPEDDN